MKNNTLTLLSEVGDVGKRGKPLFVFRNKVFAHLKFDSGQTNNISRGKNGENVA